MRINFTEAVLSLFDVTINLLISCYAISRIFFQTKITVGNNRKQRFFTDCNKVNVPLFTYLQEIRLQSNISQGHN